MDIISPINKTSRLQRFNGLNGRPSRRATVPTVTGTLERLRSSDPAVLLDVENLTASAHKLGFEFDYSNLKSIFKTSRKGCHLHAVFSRTPNDDRWTKYFEACDISAHPRDVKAVTTADGIKQSMNSDISLAVLAGVVLALKTREVVVATGDGELATEIAETLKRLAPRTRVATLGVPGSISGRLRAGTNRFVDLNLTVGRDCLVADGRNHY